MIIGKIMPRDENLVPIEGNNVRGFIANGTYEIVATGTNIVLHKLFILDPSDSGGTITIQNANGDALFPGISAVNQGQFQFDMDRYQTVDLTAAGVIDGLSVVVANCTGTFGFAITWK